MSTARVDLETQADPAAPTRGRRRWWIGVVVAVLAVLGGVWLAGRGSDDGSQNATTEIRFAEARITDLTRTEDFDGTLGRQPGEPVLSGLDGTITFAAAEGATVSQGETLFAVDGRPVSLLYGDIPAWRTLATDPTPSSVAARASGTITQTTEADTTLVEGDVMFAIDGRPVVLLYGDMPAYRRLGEGVDEGPDVLQLERALVALGYDPDGTITVDESFTANTAAAVKRWQEAVGSERDGVVGVDEVAFLQGPALVRSAVAPVGATIGPGQPVLSVMVESGTMSGVDVLQLESALAALGHDPGEVDGTFDAATAATVAAWQAQIGAESDGIVDVGEVAFLPGPVRITQVLAAAGTPIRGGGQVLATSSEEITVTVNLPASDQGKLAAGDTVAVVLPDDRDTAGTVTSVGTVATQQQGGVSTFEIIIALDDPSAAAGLDEAPVTVRVITDSRQNVLVVPVTSLLALAEGGYAVEVDQGGGQTALVAVEPGLYSSGLVEVTSAGLEAGARVVVP